MQGWNIKKNWRTEKKRVYGYDDMKMMTIMFPFFLRYFVLDGGALRRKM